MGSISLGDTFMKFDGINKLMRTKKESVKNSISLNNAK